MCPKSRSVCQTTDNVYQKCWWEHEFRKPGRPNDDDASRQILFYILLCFHLFRGACMPDVKLGDSFAQSAVLCVRPPAAFFGNGGGRTSYARNEIQMTRTSHEIYVFVLDPKHRISKLARRMSAGCWLFSRRMYSGCLSCVLSAGAEFPRHGSALATIAKQLYWIAFCKRASGHALIGTT